MRRIVLLISLLLMGACFAIHGKGALYGGNLRLGMSQRQVSKALGSQGVDPEKGQRRYRWTAPDSSILEVSVQGKIITLREKSLGKDPATRAKFGKVTGGMTLDAVVKLLGKPTRSLINPLPSYFYWIGPRGDKISASFFSGGRISFIRYDEPYAPPAVTPVKVTRAQCKRLTNGMSYPQVVAQLGCPGVDEINGVQSYEWSTPDRERLTVTFTAGRITAISGSPSCDYKRYKFDCIGIGMTLAAVRRVLRNGKLAHAPDPCYYWNNVDGGHVYATFKNGKLIRTFYQTK
ncbi:MAG: hypothetical protein ACYDBB_25145 [Armatimonadota bacterium]